MSSNIDQIPNRAVHDAIVAESEQTPTVIYVSNSALPVCKTFTPKYETLANNCSRGNETTRSIRFCQLNFTSETSMMFKFSPNQLPVVVLMCNGTWCKTLMSPSLKELESGIEELAEKATMSRA